MRPRLLPALLAIIGLSATTCGGTPDEADLQEWANSEQGFSRLARLARDASMPAELRVRGLEVVVERGQQLRVRGMIERITEMKDRESIVRQLVDSLAAQVEKRAPTQLAAKDTILLLTRYLPPDQLDHVQRVIAEWAFADISWDTPAPELKTKLEARISAPQIADLGPYGLEAAAILLANGFIAEQMVRYLSKSAAPAAKALLIRAFRRFFTTFFSVNPFYLDAIRKTQEPAGAKLLLELYQNEKLDQRSRDACYSVAAMMLDQPTIKGRADVAEPIVAELVKIGSKKSAEDRWLSAANILAVTNGAGLDRMLALFADDGIYGEPAANSNSIIDLCFELHRAGRPDTFEPVLAKAIAGGNRVQRAISIICAKVLHLRQLEPTLEALAKRRGKRDDVALQDLLGEGFPKDEGDGVPMTLGFLAANALEGMAMLSASDLPSLDDKQKKARHFVISVELSELGELYRQHVEERYRQSLEKKK